MNSTSVAFYTPTGAPATTAAYSASYQVFAYSSEDVVPFGLPTWDAGAELAEFRSELGGMSADGSRLWLLTVAE